MAWGGDPAPSPACQSRGTAPNHSVSSKPMMANADTTKTSGFAIASWMRDFAERSRRNSARTVVVDMAYLRQPLHERVAARREGERLCECTGLNAE